MVDHAVTQVAVVMQKVIPRRTKSIESLMLQPSILKRDHHWPEWLIRIDKIGTMLISITV
jgi:hypothetical protein